jgi:hypothetical protein
MDSTEVPVCDRQEQSAYNRQQGKAVVFRADATFAKLEIYQARLKHGTPVTTGCSWRRVI